MSRFNLWMAKHLHKRIEKYEALIIKLNKLIKKDKKLMQEYLDKLELVQFFEFGIDTGYIADKKSFQKIEKKFGR